MFWRTCREGLGQPYRFNRRLAMHYIGMDVHSKVTMMCVLDENGKKVQERVVRGPLPEAVARLKGLRRDLGPLAICYEASCGYGWLHDQAAPLGLKVQVAHPGKLRIIFNCKRKNDRIDAQKLAKLLYLDEVPLVHVPPAERRQWRSLIEYRQGLVKRRGACKNALRALLRNNGIVAPRGLWSGKGMAWLAGVALSDCQALQRDMHQQELRQLQEMIVRVEKVLQQWADRNPAVGLLMTIPGVGIRTAEAVVAYVDDPHRFGRNKSVGCYFGMVPCEDTSVKSRFGHITKEGPATVRKLVTEATWQAIRRDAGVKAYFERVCRDDPKRRKIALVATAHHLLRAMHSMLRSGETWRSAA